MPAGRARLGIAATVSAVCLTASAVMAVPSLAAPAVSADPAVITDWNTIAVRTIFTENATPQPRSGLYFGFVHIAMYDAVVAIEGGYEPYLNLPPAPAPASSEVAAATAAYRVLRHYFPASAGNLAADYQAFLAGAPNGPAAINGRRVGATAAAAMIRARVNDGRKDVVTLEVEPAPGVWRPTPPAFLPMLGTELGFVRPLLLDSATQFPMPGPDALTSAAYTGDFVEVRDFGARVGSSRMPAQTETANFFSDNIVAQHQAGLRDLSARHGLDIVARSRAFALLNASMGDVSIACWRSKYDEAYWRPITAITLADTDGNPATEPDPDWLPLLDTPPYPDYVSGHACYTGAASETFGYLFGADSIDLTLSSAVTGTTRQYETTDELDEDTMNARIWLGFHFRTAMTDGNELGHDVADWTRTHAFQPTD